MRLRRPSLGTVWFAANAGGALAFVLYVLQPMFFELGGEAAVRGESRYLLRLAAAADEDGAERYLDQALDLCRQHARSTGSWGPLFGALEGGNAAGLPLHDHGFRPLAPGSCWTLEDPSAPLALLVHNGSGRARRPQLRVSGEARAVRWQTLDGSAGTAEMRAGTAELTLAEVPAGGYAVAVLVPDGARFQPVAFAWR